MPTDAPKGIWPFSVDSDSSWNPEQPESHAVGNKHLAAECSAGRTLARATGTPARAHFEGPCLSCHFAVIFFFLRRNICFSWGPLSQSWLGHQCLIYWTPCILPSWGERSCTSWSCVEDGQHFPSEGLIKHQHLERMGSSCKVVARSACFLHVQLKPQAVPMNECDLNKGALPDKLGAFTA